MQKTAAGVGIRASAPKTESDSNSLSGGERCPLGSLDSGANVTRATRSSRYGSEHAPVRAVAQKGELIYRHEKSADDRAMHPARIRSNDMQQAVADSDRGRVTANDRCDVRELDLASRSRHSRRRCPRGHVTTCPPRTSSASRMPGAMRPRQDGFPAAVALEAAVESLIAQERS